MKFLCLFYRCLTHTNVEKLIFDYKVLYVMAARYLYNLIIKEGLNIKLKQPIKINCLLIGLMLIMLIFCFKSNVVMASNVISVDVGESLQKIIDEVAPNTTIVLKQGEYVGPINIQNSINITTESDATVILINKSKDAAITINAPNVSIKNISVKDVDIKEEPTIVISSDGVEIANVQVLTDNTGIHINGANQGEINDTTISSATEEVSQSYKKNGIQLYNSANWKLDNITIRNMEDGIYLERVDTISIKNSHVDGSRYGFHFMFVTNGQVENNEGTANVTGAMIMASSHIQVTKNKFLKQVENLNSQGILLYDTKNSLVSNNEIDGNRVGLYIEESSDVTFDSNMIKNNFVGLQWINSSDNTFQHNNVIGNVINVQSVGVADNHINKNFWDNASGIDIDEDGYSEVSYSINPLFYGLIKKQPPFQIFFNSPGMSFLESIYITNPELWMRDDKPKMSIELSEDMKSTASNKFDSIFISSILLLISFLIIKRTRRVLK